MPLPYSAVYNSKEFSTRNKTGIHPIRYTSPENFNTVADNVLGRSMTEYLSVILDLKESVL